MDLRYNVHRTIQCCKTLLILVFQRFNGSYGQVPQRQRLNNSLRQSETQWLPKECYYYCAPLPLLQLESYCMICSHLHIRSVPVFGEHSPPWNFL